MAFDRDDPRRCAAPSCPNRHPISDFLCAPCRANVERHYPAPRASWASAVPWPAPADSEPVTWVLEQGGCALAIRVAPDGVSVTHHEPRGGLTVARLVGRQPAPGLLAWLVRVEGPRVAMVEFDGAAVLHLFDPADGWGYAINLTHEHNSEWGHFGGDPGHAFPLAEAA